MKILVVGASGFLGAHVYQSLMNKTDVSGTGTYGRNPLFSDLRHVNLASSESVQYIMETVDPDIVLWCAKQAGGASEQELNDVGLRSLLESAQPNMRLVFVSTDGLLPGTRGYYDETTTPLPIGSDSSIALYTNSKLEAENFISRTWENCCIVRVGPIYGRSVTRSWDHRVGGIVDALSRGEAIYKATNTRRTFVHVEALAKALVELGTMDYTGIIHLGPLESANHLEFAKLVCRAFGFKEELIQAYTVPHEEITEKSIRADTTLDTRLADRLLQTRFRPITQGIVETYVSK